MKHAILIILFLFSTIASGVEPPEVDWRITVPATVKKDNVSNISLGGNIFTFEETPLHEIKQKIGFGDIEHAGDAASSQYWVCYSTKNKTVWFISHGEMGGLNNVLTQFQAISQNLGCPRLKVEYQNIHTSFGWLGMSKDSLLQLIGTPSGVSGNVLKFYHLGKKPGKYGDEIVNFDVISYMEFTIENNTVSSIYASHTTTY